MLKINLNSPVPIYEQLELGIIEMIEAGVIKQNDSLPTIRSLASQVDVAINTVARAYQELELKGYVKSSGRKGTIVAGIEPVSKDEQDKIFKRPIRELLQQGLTRQEIEKIFEENISLFFD